MRWIMTTAFLTGVVAGGDSDEVDRLLGTVRPPPRFAKHNPALSAREVTYRWWDYNEKKTEIVRHTGKKLAIFDGDRLIGYLATFRGTWREIVMHTMNPATDPGIDPDDWDPHYMRNFGDCMPLIVTGYGEDTTAVRKDTRVEGGGSHLTFIRNHYWTPDGKGNGAEASALSTTTLSVHPQLGYVLKQHVTWKTDQLPLNTKSKKLITGLPGGMLFGYGVVNPWPNSGAYAQAFFTPGATYRQKRDGTRPFAGVEYCMYWNNGLSVEAVRHGWHPVVRPSGLVGYLEGRDGWGVGLTAVGGERDLRYAVCPAWAEFHTRGPFVPENPDKDGFWRVTYTRRMVGFPPEIQDHIRKKARVLFEDRRALMIRLDGEDFEDQPLSFANPYRGMRFVRRFVTLTEERAHSGTKSIVAEGVKPEDMGRIWQRLYNEHPQARFDLRTRYRLECRVFVEGDDTEGFVIAHRAGLPDGSIYLTPESIGRYRTDSARSGEGWKKVSLEFTTNPRGGVLFLGFVALGTGRAFFDDFSLVKVSAAAAGEVKVINEQTPWRAYLVHGRNIVRDGGALKLQHGHKKSVFTPETPEAHKEAFTPLPPAGWHGADFDDHCWPRYRSDELFDFLGDYGVAVEGRSWPAQLCLRTRFGVTDPAQVKNLKLAVTCIGGAVVFVNGEELGRAFLPAGTLTPLSPAEGYPLEAYRTEGGTTPLPGLKSTTEPDAKWLPRYEKRLRTFTIEVPGRVLVKGANVLAVAVHRSPVAGPLDRRVQWSHLGIHKIALVSSGGAGVIPYAQALEGPRVWSADPVEQVAASPAEKSLIRRSWFWTMYWARGMPVKGTQVGNPFDPLRPIKLAVPRNGVGSGQVVLSDLAGLRTVKAELGPLVGPRGARIPPDRIQLRSAVQRTDLHYCDTLAEQPPENAKTVPVWIILQTPRDQVPGWYGGSLKVTGNGRAFTVPVQVLVTGVTLPPPQEFWSHIGMTHSPDATARHYSVEPWSARHFAIMEKTLKLMGQVGSDVVQVPVVLSAFKGSAKSRVRPSKPYEWRLPMIRWRKTPSGLKPDFTPLEDYLDAYAKHCGPPKALCLYVWDVDFAQEIADAYEGRRIASKTIARPRPFLVAQWDPKTGQVTEVEAPALGDERSEWFWKPVFDGVRAIVKKRGWSERVIMLGLGGDARPGKKTGDLLRRWAPYARWNLLSHFSGDPEPTNGKLIATGGLEIGVKEWPSMGRILTARQIEERITNPHEFIELPTARWLHQEWSPPFLFRTLPLMWGNLGRMGFDYWIPKGEGPQNATFFSHVNSLAAPGPDGAVPTVRFQMFREGVQDFEVRVILIKNLGGLPEDRRKSYLELLDEAGKRMQWGSAYLSQHELVHDWLGYAARVQEAAAALSGTTVTARWDDPPD